MPTLHLTRAERDLLSPVDRAILALLLEQLNVLRQRAGLSQITKAQAITRFKELLRS